MPNFNGAIVMHTLQMIRTPATLREIVVAIAKNTDLSEEELMKPVKQTVNMGHRLGFLQKVNGRYFIVQITFDMLMEEMKTIGYHQFEPEDKPEAKRVSEKRVGKSRGCIAQDSTITLVPPAQPRVAPQQPKVEPESRPRKLNRSHVLLNRDLN